MVPEGQRSDEARFGILAPTSSAKHVLDIVMFVPAGRHAEAAVAYDEGLKLEPENKTFRELGEKARAAAAEAATRALEPPPLEAKSTELKMPVQRPKAAPKPKPAPSDEPKESKEDEDGGAPIRGYKVTEDGRKTTFFNNDLDDEARRLIGDIKPKKVDAAEVQAAPSGPPGSSAWNKAGTWEERNMSAWGRDKLEALLVGVQVTATI